VRLACTGTTSGSLKESFAVELLDDLFDLRLTNLTVEEVVGVADAAEQLFDVGNVGTALCQFYSRPSLEQLLRLCAIMPVVDVFLANCHLALVVFARSWVYLRLVPTKAASACKSTAADRASILVGTVRLFQHRRFSRSHQFENLIAMDCSATLKIRCEYGTYFVNKLACEAAGP